jgi:hypothetical protein
VELGYGTTGLTIGQGVFGLCDWTRNGALRPVIGAVRPLAEAPETLNSARQVSGRTIFQVAGRSA